VHEVLARVPEARRRLRVDLAGPYDLDYEDRALALGLTGIVRFAGPLAHADSRALQRAADVLLLWKPRGEGYRTMVPGKLYEYLDAGRPVLALLPAGDEAAGLVRRADGVVLAPGTQSACWLATFVSIVILSDSASLLTYIKNAWYDSKIETECCLSTPPALPYKIGASKQSLNFPWGQHIHQSLSHISSAKGSPTETRFPEVSNRMAIALFATSPLKSSSEIFSMLTSPLYSNFVVRRIRTETD